VRSTGYEAAVRLLRVPGVFTPCSDSWRLAGRVAEEPLAPGARVLDLYTGSGVLALAAAMRAPEAEVTAVDVSRRSLLAARLNAALNGVRIRAVRGHLFAPVNGHRFGLIVSNPPYLPGPDGVPDRGPARAWEGGDRGRALIDDICREAPAHLEPGGVLLLVHSSVCGERETLDALSAAGLQASVVDRHRGPLGPRLSARAAWLRERGLLSEDGTEELLIFRAQRPGR
jgi:release factor glutamine methyltransferase